MELARKQQDGYVNWLYLVGDALTTSLPGWNDVCVLNVSHFLLSYFDSTNEIVVIFLRIQDVWYKLDTTTIQYTVQVLISPFGRCWV